LKRASLALAAVYQPLPEARITQNHFKAPLRFS